MRIRYYDIVEMSVEDINETYEGKLVLNKDKYDDFIKLCHVIDDMFTDNDGISFDFDPDNMAENVVCSIELPELIVDKGDTRLREIADKAKKIVLKNSKDEEDDSIIVEFTFDTIWDFV